MRPGSADAPPGAAAYPLTVDFRVSLRLFGYPGSPRSGVGRRPLANAFLDAEGGVDLFPQPLLSPAAEVVVDGLPRWQVMGQQPPGAAGPEPVGHGVDQLAAVMEGRAAARLGRRDERGEQLPLGIGQVGGIGAAGWDHRRLPHRDWIGTAADHTGFSDTL